MPNRKIELNWKGPISLANPPSKNIEKEIQGCGVYAWVYPSPPYAIPGIYFGVAQKIAARIWDHFGALLAGNYFIPDRGNPDAQNPELRRSSTLLDYFSNINRMWECAQETEFYYAASPECDLAACHDVERILIETLLASDAIAEKKYFSVNISLRGCRAFSGTPTEIISTGADIITNAVGIRIVYPA